MKRILLAGLLGLSALAPAARAHEVRPAYLEITEAEAGRYAVLWRTPILSGMRLPVVLELPDGVRDVREPSVQELSDSLLERRPASGIWGGLYSLPELRNGDSASDWCTQQLGAAVASERELATIEHGFTHFDLDIAPRLLRLAALPSVVNDTGEWLWCEPYAELQVGVPAPVAALLRSLDDGGADLRLGESAGAPSRLELHDG